MVSQNTFSFLSLWPGSHSIWLCEIRCICLCRLPGCSRFQFCNNALRDIHIYLWLSTSISEKGKVKNEKPGLKSFLHRSCWKKPWGSVAITFNISTSIYFIYIFLDIIIIASHINLDIIASHIDQLNTFYFPCGWPWVSVWLSKTWETLHWQTLLWKQRILYTLLSRFYALYFRNSQYCTLVVLHTLHFTWRIFYPIHFSKGIFYTLRHWTTNSFHVE